MQWKSGTRSYIPAQRGARAALRSGGWRLVVYGAILAPSAALVLLLPEVGLWLTLTLLCGLGLAATIWLLLPLPRMAVIAPLLIAGLVVALEQSNREKIGLTMFPVTPTDLTMLATSPTGVLISVGAPDWAYAALYGVPGLIALLIAVLAIRALGRDGFGWGATRLATLVLSAFVAAGALWGLYHAVLYRTSTYLLTHQTRLEVWEPAGISAFSHEVGVLGFLVYTHDIEAADRDLFLTHIPEAPPPGRDQILAAADTYILQEAMQPAPPPNIVLLHAESTFDPNLVLALDRLVTNPLFPTSPAEVHTASTHLAVPALVNTIGGGSWVTEFEVLTGVDTRLFGVAGRFTHSSLSPNADQTFLRYLAARGYQSAAYVYADGDFYNYRRGYLNYGFQEFYDAEIFKIPSNDMEIIETAMSTGTRDAGAPFLKLILLSDNHSPHHCVADHASDYETVSLAGEATEEMTCAVQEYLWRAQRSAEAAAAIEDRLIALKQTTGRDYVLAIYGDHQPYSFTGGGSATHNMGLDFNAVRLDGSKRRTLVQIRSSRPNVLNCCGGSDLPMTVLPTLISAYVAPRLDELYLPETLYTFDYCGSDWIGRLVTSSFYGKDSATDDRLCASFPEILAALQGSSVMRRSAATAGPGSALAIPPPPGPQATTALGCVDPDGNLTVEISASGTYFADLPEFAVYLDGVEIGRGKVEKAVDTATKPADPADVLSRPQIFRFKTPATQAPRSLRVEFVNDDWAGEAGTGDTDLWLQSVRVGNALILASEMVATDPANPPGEVFGAWYRFARDGGLAANLPSDICN